MAFWGVVVKPGKPVFHSGTQAQGKLRITKATLVTRSSTEKSLLRCKVMETETAFVLCSLIPNKTETCSLNLVFGETDYVMFSVVGPPSAAVHLTGYHFCNTNQLLDHTETFEYDIENSERKEDSFEDGEDDDEYGGSFIDDSEASVVATSPRRSAGKSKYEQVKKKNQDDDDEDGYMLSVWKDVEVD